MIIALGQANALLAGSGNGNGNGNIGNFNGNGNSGNNNGNGNLGSGNGNGYRTDGNGNGQLAPQQRGDLGRSSFCMDIPAPFCVLGFGSDLPRNTPLANPWVPVPGEQNRLPRQGIIRKGGRPTGQQTQADLTDE